MGTRTTFAEVIKLLEEYKEEHRHCNVPFEYKVGAINLGHIVNCIRTGKRNTTADEKQCLILLGSYGG